MREPGRDSGQGTVTAKQYGRFLLSPDSDDRDRQRHGAARRYKIRLPLVPGERGGVRLGRVSIAKSDRAGVLAHLRAWLDARSRELQALDQQGGGDSPEAPSEATRKWDQWRAVENALRELEADGAVAVRS